LLSVDAAGAHFGQPGYETDLLYLAGLLALVLGGSGPLAFDNIFLQRSSKAVKTKSVRMCRRDSRNNPPLRAA
jgi:putative oxidoreductase